MDEKIKPDKIFGMGFSAAIITMSEPARHLSKSLRHLVHALVLLAMTYSIEAKACQPPTEQEVEQIRNEFLHPHAFIFIGKVKEVEKFSRPKNIQCIRFHYEIQRLLIGIPNHEVTTETCGNWKPEEMGELTDVLAVTKNSIGIIGLTPFIDKSVKHIFPGSLKIITNGCFPMIIRIDNRPQEVYQEFLDTFRGKSTMHEYLDYSDNTDISD